MVPVISMIIVITAGIIVMVWSWLTYDPKKDEEKLFKKVSSKTR